MAKTKYENKAKVSETKEAFSEPETNETSTAEEETEEKTPEAPALAVVVESEPIPEVPNRCAIKACNSDEVKRTVSGEYTMIECLKCGYPAKYLNGKIV